MAAQRQGKFWEYHDLLFQNQKRLSRSDLVAWAKVVGLDIAQFEKDMADPALARRLQADMAEGSRVGVRGTPSVFINGRKMKSAPTSTDALVDIIKSEILQIDN